MTMIDELCVRKDVKGSDLRLMQGAMPAFAWRDIEKPRENPVRIADLRVEISNRGLPKRKRER
jgi:hypothetical protein